MQRAIIIVGLGCWFCVGSWWAARAVEPTAPPGPIQVEYRSFKNELLQRYVWMGQRVAFLTAREDLDPVVMGKLCATFDKVYDFYKETTDRQPERFRHYEGRVSIAEAENTFGAACGYLGSTGIEMTPGCFHELYDGVAERDAYDQALPYELGRNFWFYSPQLAYRDGVTDRSVVTGYAVFMRFPALDAAGAKLGPFRGRSGDEFRGEVRRLVDLYEADRSLTWENTLKIDRAPDNPMGLNGTDLFAGFCFRLAERHGGQKFIAQLWQQAAKRPAAESTQEAIDNFVLAASAAAGKDLTELFSKDWRWPVSDTAQQEAQQRFATTSKP